MTADRRRELLNPLVERVLRQRRHFAAQIHVARDLGQRDEAVLDEPGELFGDRLFELQTPVLVRAVDAEQRLTDRGLRAVNRDEARVHRGGAALERGADHLGRGEARRGRGHVAQRIELDPHVFERLAAAPHAALHDAAELALDHAIVGEHVLDVIGREDELRQITQQRRARALVELARA